MIDVGGFLGIGAKPVSVPISDLDFMRDEDGQVPMLSPAGLRISSRRYRSTKIDFDAQNSSRAFLKSAHLSVR